MTIKQTYKQFLDVKTDMELEAMMKAIMLEMKQIEAYSELLIA